MNFEAIQICLSLEGWNPIRVPSHSGEHSYNVLAHVRMPIDNWVCQCKGYQYRGRCVHQEDAADKFCGWLAAPDRTKQTASEVNEKTCPDCGGPTKWVMQVVEN